MAHYIRRPGKDHDPQNGSSDSSSFSPENAAPSILPKRLRPACLASEGRARRGECTLMVNTATLSDVDEPEVRAQRGRRSTTSSRHRGSASFRWQSLERLPRHQARHAAMRRARRNPSRRRGWPIASFRRTPQQAIHTAVERLSRISDRRRSARYRGNLRKIMRSCAALDRPIVGARRRSTQPHNWSASWARACAPAYRAGGDRQTGDPSAQGRRGHRLARPYLFR